jgi:3-methyladenine DNA glycosylase AlkD
MTTQEIFQIYENNRNPESAVKMAAYMKNNFPFLGINSPDRKFLEKVFLKEKIKTKSIYWDFVFECFGKAEREFHYLALDYLSVMKKYTQITDIELIEKLIQTKSWWDSVDGIDQIVGEMVLKFPSLKDSHIRKWMKSSNIWLVRISIDFQLLLKNKTDEKILEEAILANIGSKEFFINKAIGWILRDYSKTNKAWVTDFINEHKNELNSLSVREGSKYL